MSYEIIYDKQFVKVTNEIFIPMLLQGSNNLYDITPSGQRRYRSWYGSNFSEGISGTQNSMLEFQEETRRSITERYADEYKDSSFGYYASLSDGGGGCNMTFGRYQGIVKTGCKKALTIEQLLDEGVTMTIEGYFKEDKFRLTPRTTEELLNFIENTEIEMNKQGYRFHAVFNGMFEEKPTRIRKKYFPQEKKIAKMTQAREAFVVEFKSDTNSGYVFSVRGGSFKYTYDNRSGAKFANEKDAQRLAKKIGDRRKDIKFQVSKQSFSHLVIVKG